MHLQQNNLETVLLLMVNIPVSIGELFDKITILEIKQKNITCKSKLKNVLLELNSLNKISSTIDKTEINDLIEELKTVNSTLWNIENKIRNKEKLKVFDSEFLEIARSVYKNNDVRAEIKRKINLLTNSTLMEEKEHM